MVVEDGIEGRLGVCAVGGWHGLLPLVMILIIIIGSAALVAR